MKSVANKIKKILLLGINARFTHSNLAIRYLRNYISDLPFKIVLKEISINCSLLEILAILYEEKPEIIGISVYIWNSEIVKKLLECDNNNASIYVIGNGGSAATASHMQND